MRPSRLDDSLQDVLVCGERMPSPRVVGAFRAEAGRYNRAYTS